MHTRRSRVCHWCSYHILTSFVIYYWIRRTATWNLFVLYNNEKRFFFISKCFNITRKPAFCPAFAPPLHEKKPFYVIYEKNRASVKPDSSVAPCWMKTYSERRMERRNLQILKKMLEKSSQFLSWEQPCEPKSLDVPLKITGVEKIPSENLWLRST